MTIDFFSRLPNWRNNSADDESFIQQLKVLLNQMDASVNASIVDVVLLEQASLPSQADWETAYTSQTGKSLPIPPIARLQWWDTTNSRFGGEFGTVLNDTTVYPRITRNSPGSIHIAETAQIASTTSISPIEDLDYSASYNPTLDVTISVPCYLELMYLLSYILSSGSGSVGIDFAINGVRVGPLYYNLPVDRGVYELTDTGQICAVVRTPTLQPGTYSILPLFGNTNGTSPTGAISPGSQTLIVKGYAS